MLALLSKCARPLSGREAETGLLADFAKGLFEASGESKLDFGRWLYTQRGMPVASLLLPALGQRISIALRVTRLEAASERKEVPDSFAAGDVIVSYAGNTPEEVFDFDRNQDAARSAGRKVEVVVLRGAERLILEHDPTAAWIVVAQQLRVESR